MKSVKGTYLRGPYDWARGEEDEPYTEENEPFKGECRSCGANLENCKCWDHYKD